MKLRLRGSPFYYDFDRWRVEFRLCHAVPDADNAAVGKYVLSIAAGVLPAAFLLSGEQKPFVCRKLQIGLWT